MDEKALLDEIKELKMRCTFLEVKIIALCDYLVYLANDNAARLEQLDNCNINARCSICDQNPTSIWLAPCKHTNCPHGK